MTSQDNSPREPQLVRGLGLLDATMIVVGSMIGSGIFIVSAESPRFMARPGWLLVAWVVAGVMTIPGALCYAELATMMPHAGGVYIYLREAYGPLCGFLYGGLFFSSSKPAPSPPSRSPSPSSSASSAIGQSRSTTSLQPFR